MVTEALVAVDVDPYNQQCPTRRILTLIGDKWTSLIIGLLSQESRRFNELRRAIGGISQKMLTQTLRALERDGIVDRKVHATVPPRVDYSLTALGHSLVGPLEAVRMWAEAHVAEIDEAHERYDRRPPSDAESPAS